MRLRYLLSDATLGLQVLAALSFVLVSARFAWTGLEQTLEEGDEPIERDRGSEEADASAGLSTSGSEEAGSLSSEPDLPELRRRQVLVDFGPTRSEVFLNGRVVGKTPYVGQISCRDGDRIRIDVVPPEGMPERRTAICHGGSFQAPDTVSRMTKEDLPAMELVEERMKELEESKDLHKRLRRHDYQ